MDRTALQGAVLNRKAALLHKEEVPPAWVLPLSAGIHRAQLPRLCFPLNNREKSRGKGDIPEIKALFLAARIAQGMGWLGAEGGGARSHLSARGLSLLAPNAPLLPAPPCQSCCVPDNSREEEPAADRCFRSPSFGKALSTTGAPQGQRQRFAYLGD